MLHKKSCRCEDCLAEIEVSKAEDAAERAIYATEMWRMGAEGY